MGSKDKSRKEKDKGPRNSAKGVSLYGSILTKERGDYGGNLGIGRTWDRCNRLSARGAKVVHRKGWVEEAYIKSRAMRRCTVGLGRGFPCQIIECYLGPSHGGGEERSIYLLGLVVSSL